MHNFDLSTFPNKMIRLVGELHQRGYQSLYLDCQMSPSGCHWRYRIFTDEKSLINGSFGNELPELIWLENWSHSIEQWADDFIAHFGHDLQIAKKENPEYVEWLQNVIEKIGEKGYFIMFDEYRDTPRCYGQNGWVDLGKPTTIYN